MSDIFATYDERGAVSLLAGQDSERGGLLDEIGRSLSIPYGAKLYSEGDPAKYLYVVISGAVRACRFSIDGQRQIIRFCLPGDTFGFEPRVYYTVSTEAISNTSGPTDQTDRIL